MALQNLPSTLLRTNAQIQKLLGCRTIYRMILPRIGKREVVGCGWSNLPIYADRLDFPLPAIRFREPSPEVMALREKEKGDWNKMSIEDKKALYRASFCQTFSEMKHPTGEWKLCAGVVLLCTAGSLLLGLFMRGFVYDQIPDTFSEERRKAQLKRILTLEIDGITGLSSKWDYENKKWK
ncbi:cytochrome c oxidase subunit 4 isoform 1, mitochondrial-like [Uranotaenia lowii]|uniref:cytochrome c oxidase subunit 4 isoform 1, mitochondrial-like n=1 Tax=Uranotaenia lowii TaxID=190385 RepID=UPI00247A64A5|nr:cytochrome c oxidase subunit 4 isoform 1, mitochondrial-like [Uranotaenia lowii]